MHSDANFVRVEGLFVEQTGYATPKVDVRGAVIEDGRNSSRARDRRFRTLDDAWRVGRRKPVAERVRHPRAAGGKGKD
jgi:hypothetical protein